MRRPALLLSFVVLATWSCAIVARGQSTEPASASATQPASKPADVPVRQVVLFSSGVGYFEHFGTVTGDSSTQLQFKTQQINDVLKSLVLQDVDGGKVGVVTYPSQDPIGKTLRSFQVDITANPSLAELLNQLRGARVQALTTQGVSYDGVVLGVERKRKPADKGEPIDQAVLNVMNDSGISAITLDDVSKLTLLDPQLQAELTRALSALAQARDKDKKPVNITFAGQGDRRVRVGYVVETPIWKTSYRLLLPGGGAQATEKPKLQGWAIVENQTDNDWKNVQLSLVSGRPISFVMDLYQPLYIPRPVVMPELYASLRPQTYDAGVEAEKVAGGFGMTGAGAAPAAPGAMANQMAANSTLRADLSRRKAQMQAGEASMATLDQSTINPTASVATVASAARIGELFQYTVGNVSLPRQKSAMLPIITDDIEVEKLSIYNQSVLPKNPLNGARVKNTTTKHLLQGPITVLEGSSYAGDAQVDNLPPGQERMISYGIDLQMLIDATKNKTEDAIQTGKIVKGVMQIQRKHVATQEYLADNKSDHEKTLIIEHPIRHGWELTKTDKPVETTQDLYRFKGKVGAGKSSKLVVTEQMVDTETFAILPADFGQVELYSRTGEIPKEVRDALVKAMQLKQAVAETQRQIALREQQLQRLSEDEGRVRENLKTVPQNSQPYARLLTKLNDQETKIEQTQSDRDNLNKQREEQQKALEDYLNNLSVG